LELGFTARCTGESWSICTMNEFVWSKEHSLKEQQNRSVDIDIQDLNKKAEYFSANEYLLREEPNVIIDIGGGFRGGALSLYKGKDESILVDILANEFVKLGHIPKDVKVINANFDNIPLGDEYADAIFAWETYDHAQTFEHYTEGLQEMNRLLKCGGLFFMMLPLRFEPRENHPMVLNVGDVRRSLRTHKIIREFAVGKPAYLDLNLFVVSRKIVNAFVSGYVIMTDALKKNANSFYTGKHHNQNRITYKETSIYENILFPEAWSSNPWEAKIIHEWYPAVCYSHYVESRRDFKTSIVEHSKLVEYLNE